MTSAVLLGDSVLLKVSSMAKYHQEKPFASEELGTRRRQGITMFKCGGKAVTVAERRSPRGRLLRSCAKVAAHRAIVCARRNLLWYLVEIEYACESHGLDLTVGSSGTMLISNYGKGQDYRANIL